MTARTGGRNYPALVSLDPIVSERAAVDESAEESVLQRKLQVSRLVELAVGEFRARGVRLDLPSPLHRLPPGTLGGRADVEILVKRDDLISPLLPGNKFRKLVPHVGRILADHPRAVLTFGGAYSNHLYAFSSAAKLLRFEAIAVVRGERIEPLNPILAYAESCGVTLHFVSRDDYRLRRDDAFIASLTQQFGPFYLIPEGGTDRYAVAAVSLLADEIEEHIDSVVTAVGTGGTLAGLVLGFAKRGTSALGIAVLRAGRSLEREVERLVGSSARGWRIEHRYTAGGFARTTPSLWEFVERFENTTDIQLDLTYTGKAFFALDQMLRNGEDLGRRILVLHTGGIPLDTRSTLRARGR